MAAYCDHRMYVVQMTAAPNWFLDTDGSDDPYDWSIDTEFNSATKFSNERTAKKALEARVRYLKEDNPEEPLCCLRELMRVMDVNEMEVRKIMTS
jgi:hypothetical protein